MSADEANGRQPSREKHPRGAGKNPSVTITVGEQLEYRVMRLFMAQGYFVRRGVEIYTDQFLNRATDLDVIAVRFIAPFRHTVQIAECKSGGNKPLDRIFWLSGVRMFAEANNATFVRDNTSWDIKDFARRNSVELLDKRSIDELERTLDINPDYWPGMTDRGFIQRHAAEWNKELRKDADIVALYLFLLGEFRWTREVASIRYIIFMMRRLTRLISGEPSVSLWRMLLVDCFANIVMYFMYFAGRTLGLTAKDIDALARKEMKYGTLDSRVVDRMMRYAMKLSEQVLESLGVSGKRIDATDFDYPEPSDADEILRMFRLISASPIESSALPSFVDYVLSERYLKGNRALPMLDSVKSGANTALLLSIASGICKELSGLGALPPEFSASFGTQSERVRPKSSESTLNVHDAVSYIPDVTRDSSKLDDSEQAQSSSVSTDLAESPFGEGPEVIEWVPDPSQPPRLF